MIRVGIIGGDGHAAGELIRLLLNHPDVELEWVSSGRNAGNRICAVHQGLIGETDLTFTADMPFEDADMLFVCAPHGESRKLIESHEIPERMKIVDMSQDFRVSDGSHDFIYGLPEVNRKYIIRGRHVANPGCFATAIQLALLPLAKNLLLNSDIHIAAVAGTGQSGNMSVENPFNHPHLAEIRQTLQSLQSSFSREINLVPVRGGFSRGVLVAAYMDCPIELKELEKLYMDYYDDHNFTFLSDRMPDLKDVANTNKCILHLAKENGKLLVVSVIDSLLKGASGQAVHNMNLLFGLHERVGLQLKASVL